VKNVDQTPISVNGGSLSTMWRQYLTAKIAKEIEHRIQTKEKWERTISVQVNILPEEIAT
jgi:hypothetical protein